MLKRLISRLRAWWREIQEPFDIFDE